MAALYHLLSSAIVSVIMKINKNILEFPTEGWFYKLTRWCPFDHIISDTALGNKPINLIINKKENMF